MIDEARAGREFDAGPAGRFEGNFPAAARGISSNLNARSLRGTVTWIAAVTVPVRAITEALASAAVSVTLAPPTPICDNHAAAQAGADDRRDGRRLRTPAKQRKMAPQRTCVAIVQIILFFVSICSIVDFQTSTPK